MARSAIARSLAAFLLPGLVLLPSPLSLRDARAAEPDAVYARAGPASQPLLRRGTDQLIGGFAGLLTGIARQTATDSASSQSWIGPSLSLEHPDFPLVSANRSGLLALRDFDIFMAGVETIIDAAERQTVQQ